jgi:hypothetical protein
MTQSETTAGWCASRAALGFNDSGSFAATLFLGASPSGSLSFNGWSQSTDTGGSYTDRGALLADPLPPGIEFRDLLGDPVLGCSSEANFYYASLAMEVGPGGSFANSGISVSRSTNGATSFDSTVMAVVKDAFFHFLDKEWLAVEPGATPASSDDVLHVTYTDFDFSGFAEQNKGLCPDDVRVAIEYVRSTDGGDTWTSPLVLEEVCAAAQGAFLQGSQVEAGLGDDVYAAWERLNDDQTRAIRIRKSTDLGASFGAASVATLSGSLSCSRQGTITVTGTLRQQIGKRVTVGSFRTTVACDGTESWSATVVGETGQYRHGSAQAVVLAEFVDVVRGEVVRVRDAHTVQLS